MTTTSHLPPHPSFFRSYSSQIAGHPSIPPSSTRMTCEGIPSQAASTLSTHCRRYCSTPKIGTTTERHILLLSEEPTIDCDWRLFISKKKAQALCTFNESATGHAPDYQAGSTHYLCQKAHDYYTFLLHVLMLDRVILGSRRLLSLRLYCAGSIRYKATVEFCNLVGIPFGCKMFYGERTASLGYAP